MQPNPSPRPPQRASEPLLEVVDGLVPEALHTAAWSVCSGKGWYFGHGSHAGDWSRFWKMDLEGDSTFNAIWEQVRPRCEELAGAPLRVVRQYANGHTYGLGGQPHLDDHQPGAYTLLYYPNPEWKDGWDGETVFYDQAGEIALAVRPRPNRAVFFDSRILHAGRAPSRLCPALRVTVAYKLQVAPPAPKAEASKVEVSGAHAAEPQTSEPPAASQPVPPAPQAPRTGASCTELAERRAGASRVYLLRVGASVVDRAVEEHLTGLGKTVRLPGFRPGKIPMAVLQQRYGARARVDATNRVVAEATQQMLPRGALVGSLAARGGAESGDLEFEAAITYLPDLPAADFSALSLERLAAGGENLQAAGVSAEQAAALFRHHLKLQVLDHLDAAYPLPLLPFLVEREYLTIWKAAEAASEIPSVPAERERLEAEFRAIAERRLRLGAVVAEIARRNGFKAHNSAGMEDQVVDFLVSQARVQDRQASTAELRELAGLE